MELAIIIDVDHTAAIAAGKASYGRKPVRITEALLSGFGVDLRNAVSQMPLTVIPGQEPAVNPYAALGTHPLTQFPKIPAVPDYSDQSVSAVVHAWAREAARIKAESDESLRKVALEVTDALAAELARPAQDWVCNAGIHANVNPRPGVLAKLQSPIHLTQRELDSRPEYRERIRQAEQIAAAIEQEREASRRAMDAQASAKKAQAREVLLEWAQEHGSAKLRECLALNIGDLDRMAASEFQDAFAPTGYVRGTARGDARKEPTAAEIGEYRSLLAHIERVHGMVGDKFGQVLTSPSIDYVSAEDSDDGEAFTSVEVNVTAPTGASAWYMKRIELGE